MEVSSYYTIQPDLQKKLVPSNGQQNFEQFNNCFNQKMHRICPQ